MKTLLLALTLAVYLDLNFAKGETVKDRRGAVLDDRSNMEKDTRWIYNDWKEGFAESKKTGKPLLVVLRCVPCLACAGIDASVLKEPELEPLLNKFVRVRLIKANGLDLSLFQFDYDLSFSTIFFNADGTVYGRYGSWTHQRNSRDSTIGGFKRALEGTLELHGKYPSNKRSLKNKQGMPMPVKDPLELPELAGKYKRELDWEGKVVQSCVHCHQVGDGVRSLYRSQKKDIPEEWIYPMPAPETIGLTLADERGGRVETVEEGSIGAKAGLQVGDEIVSVEGQPLISIADFSWALHRAPNFGKISAVVKREGNEKTMKIDLPEGWRTHSDISRRVGTWPMRAMAIGGLKLKELGAEERSKRNLEMNKMALFVEHAGEYGIHAAAKKAGFQKGDVLVEVDGVSSDISESELIGRLLEKYKGGEKVKSTVLRESDRLELLLPIQ